MENEIFFSFMGIDITESIIVQWIIMIVLILLAYISTKDLKKIPSKSQVIVEEVFNFLKKTVIDNMGKDAGNYTSFIGTLSIYLLTMNLIGLFAIKPPTSDYNVALGLAIISFIVIQANAIKKIGVKKYFKGYTEPVAVILPINIVERLVFPVSLSLRLFGNIFAATLIMEIIYEGIIKLFFPAAIGIPIPFHLYFDIFDGGIQTVIFVLLTMVNIKIVEEH